MAIERLKYGLFKNAKKNFFFTKYLERNSSIMYTLMPHWSASGCCVYGTVGMYIGGPNSVKMVNGCFCCTFNSTTLSHQARCALSALAHSGALGSVTCGPSWWPTRAWMWSVRESARLTVSFWSSSKDSATTHQWEMSKVRRKFGIRSIKARVTGAE